MSYLSKLKKAIVIEGILLCVLGAAFSLTGREETLPATANGDYIKWVDFTVSYEALCKAYELDIGSQEKERQVDWIELLAYAAAKTGGNFNKKSLEEMDSIAKQIEEGETTMKKAVRKLEYYPYYHEAYSAILSGFVGEYEIEREDEKGNVVWEKEYGLKAFSPIAMGFPYEDYDDFGASRSYGYSRPHLGHDMMGQIGTPVVAVEGGTVEALGWNQYGGWRIGIRSHDGKRYYYYAHLRQNYPYAEGLEEGSEVLPGDVIGYMGHTGYSTTENVNNIKVTHLHWGMQLIFDESQKEGNNEIWIDVYPLTRFLYKNRSEAVKKEGTKEWVRKYQIREEKTQQ